MQARLLRVAGNAMVSAACALACLFLLTWFWHSRDWKRRSHRQRPPHDPPRRRAGRVPWRRPRRRRRDIARQGRGAERAGEAQKFFGDFELSGVAIILLRSKKFNW